MNNKIKFSNWRDILDSSIISAGDLAEHFSINSVEVEKVTKLFPMLINPYYLSLIKEKDDPLWKQAVPDKKELENYDYSDDPLHEEEQSPVLNIVHRYPDRVLFLVSSSCAVYCRFCMRKRMIGGSRVTGKRLEDGISYIRREKRIREVLVSGGDPLLLEDEQLEDILARLHSISHVEVIRIHTRVPSALPQRVTKKLADMLKKYHPVFINIHFNHHWEITPESTRACAILADAGIPLGSQTVLLKGVNDNGGEIKCLMRGLLKIRVRPYYIHHPDCVRGTGHFRFPVEKGINIMKNLYGHISGMCIPQYMIDLPGGWGKVPIVPEYVEKTDKEILLVKNYQGVTCKYPNGIQ